MIAIARGVAERVAASRGCELVDIELKRSPGGPLLRLYVDRQGGVGLDELQEVSLEVSAILDVEDPLPARYTLEVSSPGLDRPLTTEGDWRRAVGRLVKLTLREPREGRPRVTGRLVSAEGGLLSLRLEAEGDAPFAVPVAEVAQGRLEVDWKRGAKGPRPKQQGE